MKTHAFATSAFLALVVASSAAPQLVVSTPLLVPESKIDLVLDLPVIETTEIGKTVDNTWLEIQPALPGKLRWRAQNIAEFVPDRSPAIGASYTFSIPKNRKHLDATTVPAGKITTLETESFRILSSNAPNRWSSDYSPSTAEWLLVFNDDTDPATASAFISFVSKNGQRIAAKLERATAERAGYFASNYKPWTARWKSAPAAEIKPTALVPSILIATPLDLHQFQPNPAYNPAAGFPQKHPYHRTPSGKTHCRDRWTHDHTHRQPQRGGSIPCHHQPESQIQSRLRPD